MENGGPFEHALPKGIVADRADAEAYQRRRAQQPAGPVAAAPGMGVNLLFLLVLVLAGAIAFSAWRASTERDLAESRLQSKLDTVAADLAKVSAEVYATGETLTEAGSATDKQIRYLNAEIRKLWAVANERNKKNIEENAAQQKQSSAKIAALEKSVGAVQKTLEEEGRAGASVSKQLEEVRKEFKTFREAATKEQEKLAAAQKKIDRQQTAAEERELALQTRIDQVAAQLRGVDRQVKALQEVSSRLEAALSGAEKRGAELESLQQAVRSIDTFRQQTNKSLTNLQTAVNALQSDVERMKQAY